MATMAAVCRTGKGLAWDPQCPKPKVKPGCVLVKVHASCLNPVDYKAPKMLLGRISGVDVAGIVEEVGTGISEIKAGDEIFGTTIGGSGGLAEYALVKGTNLHKKPHDMPWAVAGALPTAYLTSLQALRDHSQMKEGDKVLVIGASGGCGIAGLQLAKFLKAGEVVAVCSGANAEFCKQHGADRVIDYKVDLVGKQLKDVIGAKYFDVVYDCATNSGAGENYTQQALEVLKDGHVLSAINGSIGTWLRMFCGLQKRNHKIFLTQANTADLGFLGNAKLTPPFAEGFDGAVLNENNFKKGLELIMSRRARGKIAFVWGR